MNFEPFDFASSSQCEADLTTYSIENFSNTPRAPFAVIPLNLTNDDLRDLNDLYVDNTCPCDPFDHGPDTPDFGRCEGQFSSNEFKPKSYFQDPTYRDDVERHFKGYESLKPKPELMNRLVDLIVRLTNNVAEIIPGTLINPGFITYAADSKIVKDSDFQGLSSRLVDLIVILANKVAEIIPNTLINHGFIAYAADSELVKAPDFQDPSGIWHRDGDRDERVECYGKRYIFLATLKGDHTLYCTGSYDSDLKKCVPDTSIFSAPHASGTLHKIGKLYGAFHSAPPMNGQRFVFATEIRYPECIIHRVS
jgi:hypothetical protein